MFFNSLEYLFFLPLVFIVYWSLRKKLLWQNSLLLLASYFFYGLWDYRFLSLIILSSFTDYWVGRRMGEEESEAKRKMLLCVSLGINLGFLMVFKYCNFFIGSFIDLLGLIGLKANPSFLNIVLPVGISFYTFQTLSYTIDIYRKQLKPTKSWLNFFTYVAYFPQLVAGPIERATQLLPQIEKPRTFSYEKARDGMRQILWGLFKKVAIADNCAMYVDDIFMQSAEMGAGVHFLGMFLFAFQIYADFSGYSDIAIGTSRLLGIGLMQNFSTPYFSRDFAEFWRRWHISLSTWFRDYLYIPLGGSRVSRSKQLRNVLAIFLVSGFWHGANWTFIIWGLIHALMYIPQIYFDSNRKFLGTIGRDQAIKSREIFSLLSTFLLVCIAWIFFRAENLSAALSYLGQMLPSKGWSLSVAAQETGWELHHLWITLVMILLMLITEWFNRGRAHGLSQLIKLRPVRWFFYLFLCLMILEFFAGQKTFIYFQF